MERIKKKMSVKASFLFSWGEKGWGVEKNECG